MFSCINIHIFLTGDLMFISISGDETIKGQVLICTYGLFVASFRTSKVNKTCPSLKPYQSFFRSFCLLFLNTTVKCFGFDSQLLIVK